MSKTVLVHNNGQRKYRSIVRHLSKKTQQDISFKIENVHQKLFDLSYVARPAAVVLPIVEYTQEIHNYIEQFHKTTKIFLYVDVSIGNDDLVQFLNQTNCSYICEKSINFQFNNRLEIDNLYDDALFYRIPHTKRNNKVAIALSADNKKNDIIKDILYPKLQDYKIVLFNNPEFQSIQNIGIFNEADLNYILNTFSYFLDIDEEFIVEASLSDINIISASSNDIIQDIKSQNFVKSLDTTKVIKCSELINDIILPYLGI